MEVINFNITEVISYGGAILILSFDTIKYTKYNEKDVGFHHDGYVLRNTSNVLQHAEV